MTTPAPAAPAPQNELEEEGKKSWLKALTWMEILFLFLAALTLTWLVLAVISHPSKAEVAGMIGRQHADTIKEMKENILPDAMKAERDHLTKNYGLTLGGHQVVAQQQPIVVSCQSACPVPAAAPKRVAAITPVAPQPQQQARPHVHQHPQAQQPRKADVVTSGLWGWSHYLSSAQNPMKCYIDEMSPKGKKPANCSNVEVQTRLPGEDFTAWLDRAAEKEGIRGQSKVLGRM